MVKSNESEASHCFTDLRRLYEIKLIEALRINLQYSHFTGGDERKNVVSMRASR